jgi:hypothetical protein
MATITKKTKSFIFGNFNTVDWFSKEHSKKIMFYSLKDHKLRILHL